MANVLSFFPGGDGNFTVTEMFERKCTQINLSGVSTITSFAFAKNFNLTNVTMPDVTTIETEAFHMCESLTSVNTPNLSYIHSYAFGLGGSYLGVQVGSTFSTASHAFDGCSTVWIALFNHSKVSTGKLTVGESCFANCSALMFMLFTGAGSGYWTFSSKYLFSNAFSNATTSNPAQIYIHILSSTITNYAFNCTQPYILSIESFYGTNVPTLGNSSTTLGSTIQRIFVPSAAVNAFKSATNWSKYSSIITAFEDFHNYY